MKYDIPLERKIVLCAGTLRWWAMSREIIAAANNWPEDYVLVMHSRQLCVWLTHDMSSFHLMRFPHKNIPTW